MHTDSHNEQTKNQLIKFSIVGIINVSISFVVFYFCYHLQITSFILNLLGSIGDTLQNLLISIGFESIDGAVSNVIGYAAGMINSFFLNKLWTFQTKSNTLRQAHRFFILNIIGLVLSTSILFLFVDVINWPYIPVWIFSTGLVMVLNFLGNKYWAFAETTIPTTKAN